ncbi:helix-loop-helix domain-containing protein [Streptomyces eurythermus]|uniref:helix-loop-helix domain-containing protein n=1 Tax=Streptomyces eurythermus TaxID=42237 RepID=UPI0033DFB03E
MTAKDNKTGILACSSPSPSEKNHLYQSATKPEGGKADNRITHNDIERRYRTNLKSSFAELKAAIPALNEQQDGLSDGTANHATLKATKVVLSTFVIERRPCQC